MSFSSGGASAPALARLARSLRLMLDPGVCGAMEQKSGLGGSGRKCRSCNFSAIFSSFMQEKHAMMHAGSCQMTDPPHRKEECQQQGIGRMQPSKLHTLRVAYSLS